MNDLVAEVQEWNSPIIGAFLLWRFTQGYSEAHSSADAPVALLHFMALPLLISSRLAKPINKHRDSLQSYIRSFENEKDSDILMTIHNRAKENRTLVMASIDIAVASGLLYWDTGSGKLFPKKSVAQPRKGKGLRTQYLRNGMKAELLGKWFAMHSVATVATYLKVVL